MELEEVISAFAQGMQEADRDRPVAVSSRTRQPYQSGLGPHTERITVRLVVDQLERHQLVDGAALALEVPYPAVKGSRCDLCIGPGPDWAIEVKMLRMMGDNGKPNDNMLMHLLSPYPAHRSALTDCTKLMNSGFAGRKAIIIFGYDYPDWPMRPAIEAFEALAARHIVLRPVVPAPVDDLVHPVHCRGAVFGWELTGIAKP